MAFLASCLGRLGDEAALTHLRRALKDEKLDYAATMAIKYTIERITGEYIDEDERDFSSDVLYQTIAQDTAED